MEPSLMEAEENLRGDGERSDRLRPGLRYDRADEDSLAEEQAPRSVRGGLLFAGIYRISATARGLALFHELGEMQKRGKVPLKRGRPAAEPGRWAD